MKRVAALANVPDQPDWAKWYKKEYGKEPSYSELLDQLSSSPEERRSILHAYIEPSKEDIEQGRRVPTEAHRAIGRLVSGGYIRVIITTNFDRLLENALREVGIEPTVIKSDDDLKGAVPIIHSRCVVIKVHGDYLDTRIRNTEAESVDTMIFTVYTSLKYVIEAASQSISLAICSMALGVVQRLIFGNRFPAMVSYVRRSVSIFMKDSSIGQKIIFMQTWILPPRLKSLSCWVLWHIWV